MRDEDEKRVLKKLGILFILIASSKDLDLSPDVFKKEMQFFKKQTHLQDDELGNCYLFLLKEVLVFNFPGRGKFHEMVDSKILVNLGKLFIAFYLKKGFLVPVCNFKKNIDNIHHFYDDPEYFLEAYLYLVNQVEFFLNPIASRRGMWKLN